MKNIKIISVFIATLFLMSCATTQRVDLTTKERKDVTGAFCQLVMPPVKVTLEAGGKTFYYFLGKNSCHPFLDQKSGDNCETVKWYLAVTEDPELFKTFSTLKPEEIGLLTVAEIPPLTNYYSEVIKAAPIEIRQKLEDMNDYRVYQIFGRMVAPRVVQPTYQPQQQTAPAQQQSPAGKPPMPRKPR